MGFKRAPANLLFDASGEKLLAEGLHDHSDPGLYRVSYRLPSAENWVSTLVRRQRLLKCFLGVQCDLVRNRNTVKRWYDSVGVSRRNMDRLD